MFNNLFGNMEEAREGGKGGFDFCGCNCLWIFLIILFLCFCCGGKQKNINLMVNPCCLLLAIALLFCCGGISLRPCPPRM